jgi:hypothetical protein
MARGKGGGGMGIGDLSAFFMIMLMVGVFSAIGLKILSDIRIEVGEETDAGGAINKTIEAYNTALTWLGLIALVFSAALLIVILMRAFSGGGRVV